MANSVSLSIIAILGLALVATGMFSFVKARRGTRFATSLMLLAGMALLAFVVRFEASAAQTVSAKPAVVYNPKKYPAKPYPTPELFRKSRGKMPKTQNI